MTVGALVGSFFPALLVCNCWNYHKRPANWNGFEAVLVNGAIAGFSLPSAADRALGLLGASLFVFGIVNGVFFALLTASRFRQEWIWNWWRRG